MKLLWTLPLLALSAPAFAESEYSDMIVTRGLAATEDILSERDANPSDRFALGGVQFLRAIEKTLQARYDVGIPDHFADWFNVPLFRLPVGENPSPSPARPDILAETLTVALTDLGTAADTLATIADDDAVSVQINLDDIWFDINANGQREAGEGIMPLFGIAPLSPDAAENQTFVVAFDTADAAWLAAYAHLLSATSELALSLDPTEAIERVIISRATLGALNDGTQTKTFMTPSDSDWMDALTLIVHALEGPIDATRTRAAHDHLLAMLAHNKQFWSRVEAETDDTLEWIPNDRQSSVALDVFPQGVGTAWQAVLADADALLTGELLLPHWRLRDGLGLNLAAILQNPPDLDIISILQGEAVLPYVEEGKRVERTNLRRFQDLTLGNGLFFALLLN